MSVNMPSKTMVSYPIVTALVAADQFLGAHQSWQAVNDQQARFLAEIFEPGRTEGTKIPEIESLASRNVDEINAFLRQRGFRIQLKPFPSFPPGAFGTASVLDLLVEWQQAGDKTTIEDNSKKGYPAVRLSKGVNYYQNDTHRHPIAAITTKSEDIVYMTMIDDAPHEFDLIAVVEKLTASSHSVGTFSGVIFPMVDLDQCVDIRWLRNMTTIDEGGMIYYIEQALQQTILKMNEEGARAKSAVAMSFAPTGAFHQTKPYMIINKPFLIWFVRSGLSKPLFAGYITQEDWKKPASIR